MKKTFRTILAGAVALLAVSCYDDSDIRSQIEGIDERVTALENTLNAEVGGLQDLISRVEALEGKVAAIKVETKDGLSTLTLSDGSKVVLSKNGVLTITEDDEWATVAADGTVTPLGIKVDHELDFKVEGGELKVSYDGTSYEATGVKISEYTAHVIGDVVPAEDGKSVTLKIGDKTLTLPLSAASGEISLSRGDFYLGYGLSKTLTVSGAEDFYVAAKPDGWKVSVDGNVLTVTAPSQAAAELGVIETEGQIVVHADADDCAYVSVNVSTGAAFSIEVDTATGMVTFFNALSVEYPDHTGMGAPTYDFGDALVGIMTVSDMEYFTSVDELLDLAEYGNIPSGYLNNIKGNNDLGGDYVAGQYEEDTFSISLEDLGASLWPKVAIEEGVHYVVWAVPQTDKVLKEYYTEAYYKPIKISFEPKTVSFNDVTATLTCSGAAGYYSALYEASQFEYMSFKDFMMTGYMGVGAWVQFQQTGNPSALGTEVSAGDIALSTLNWDEPLKPNTKYVAYVFPLQEGKAPADYVFETDLEPYLYEFTTTALEAGAPAATLALDSATDYSSISVAITVPEGTTAYYYFFEPGAADDMSDAELANYVMEYCYYPTAADKVVKESYLSGGDRKEIVVVTVSQDGKYGIAREVFAAKSYPISTDISVTVGSVTPNTETGEYTVVFNVTGATKFVAWNNYTTTASAFLGNVAKNALTAGYSTYKWVDVVDGKATLTVKPSSTSYKYLVYTAYNVSDTDLVSIMEPSNVALFE